MFFWPASFSFVRAVLGLHEFHFSMVCAVMNLTVAWNDVDRERIHLLARCTVDFAVNCAVVAELAQSSGRSVPQQGLKEHVELVDLSTFNPLVSDGSNSFSLRIRSDTSPRDVAEMLPIIESCPLGGVLISIFECPTSWITPNWLYDTVQQARILRVLLRFLREGSSRWSVQPPQTF